MIWYVIVLSLGVGVLVIFAVPLLRLQVRNGCRVVARACRQGGIRCLQLGAVKSTETDGGFLVGVAIRKWWDLLTCGAVFVGEMPLLVLRGIHFIGIRVHIPFLENSPLLGFLAGMSIWLAPGIVLLVVADELLPEWLRTWEIDQKWRGIVRKIGCWIFCTFLIPLFLLQLETTYQLLKSDHHLPIDVHAIAVAIFNVLLVPTLVPIVIGLGLGIAGFGGTLLLFFFCVCTLFAFLLSLGRYTDIIVSPNPGVISGTRIVEEQGEGQGLLSLPEGRSEPRPVAERKKVVPDNKVNGFVFCDRSSRLAAMVAEAVRTGGGQKLSRFYAIVDRSHEYPEGVFSSALGRDVSPYQQRELVSQGGNIDEHAFYSDQCLALNRLIVQDVGGKTVNITVYAPLKSLPAIAIPLSKLQKGLFNGHISVVTIRSRQEQVKGDITEAVRVLSRVGIHPLFLDGDSSFAAMYGQEIQERSGTSVAFNLSIARGLSSQNMTVADVTEQLHTYAPASQCVFSQAPVDSGKPYFFIRMAKRVHPKLQDRGRGDFADLKKKAISCTKEIAGEVEKKGVGTHIPFFIYTVPFTLFDVKHGKLFHKFIEEIQVFLKWNFPDATAIVVRGDIPDVQGMEGSQHRVGVCGLVPLAHVAAGTGEGKSGLVSENVVVDASLNGRIPREKMGKRKQS